MSWFGSVRATGYVFDEALLGRDELVRRVLAGAAQLSHRLNYRPTEVAA